jgi:hypothetical protein
MKDLYAKIIQTTIALALLVIVWQNQILIQKMQSSSPSTTVDRPAGLQATHYQAVNRQTPAFALVPLSPDGSVKVSIKELSETMDINISRISTNDDLNLNLNRLGGSSIYNALPVQSDR